MTLIMENDVQYIVEPLFLYLRFIAMTLTVFDSDHQFL